MLNSISRLGDTGLEQKWSNGTEFSGIPIFQDNGDNCDIISGLQASRKTDFPDIFLFSYKQCTFALFFGEFISSQ